MSRDDSWCWSICGVAVMVAKSFVKDIFSIFTSRILLVLIPIINVEVWMDGW